MYAHTCTTKHTLNCISSLSTNKIFKRINQPYLELDIKVVIEGIKKFRDEYNGKIWLEVLFVKGVNDKWSEVESLKTAIDYINPDRVQLNTVDRPPAFSLAKPVDEGFLKKMFFSSLIFVHPLGMI